MKKREKRDGRDDTSRSFLTSTTVWSSRRTPPIQQLAVIREEVLFVIFLDLTKVYDALDRSRCLEILEGYGVGPSARRLLTTY